MNSRWACCWMVLLVGCAPAVTTQQETVPVQNAEVAVAMQLQQAFQQVWQDKNIQINTQAAYRYTGNAPGGFTALINLFYKNHPGFCPVVDGFYISETRNNTFMTLTASGSKIAAFIYDQSEKPSVTYAYVEGTTTQPPEIRPCDNDSLP